MAERKRVYEARDDIRRTLISDDETPDRFVTHTEQDVEPILDGIHRDRELMPHGTNKLVARLPLFIVESLISRGIYHDEDRFKEWLNGPEATPWRVWKGSV